MATCPNYQISDGTTCSLQGLKNYSDTYSPLNGPNYFTQYTQNNFNVLVSSNIKIYNSNVDTPLSRYTICDINNNNEAKLNCSFQKNSPWFEYNDNTNKCEPSQTILPSGFFINNNIINKPTINEYLFSPNEKYCENTWYDWFTIPNYHLGNGYYSSNVDIFTMATCYAPCSSYEIPYNNDIGSVCMSKDKIYGGLYGNTIDYSPLALIMLLGASDQDLLQHYINTLNNNANNINKSLSLIDPNILSRLSGGSQNTYIYNMINKAKIDIQKAINNILKDYKPYSKDASIENIKLLKKNNFINNLNYKSSSYTVPDENMQDVLYNANLLDPILYLNTCYNIAKNTYNATITSYDLFNSDINTFYNNYKSVITTLSSFTTEKEKNNYVDNNFNIYYRICNIMNLNLTIPYEYDKIINLANIFKKACNICFDNKSSFSIYLFNQMSVNNSTPVSYGDQYFDSQYDDKCSIGQYKIFDNKNNKYICKPIPQCSSDKPFFNHATNKCEIKNDNNESGTNCSGNKLYKYKKKENKIDNTKLPISFDSLPNYSRLMYISFWILIIFFIILIFVIFSELFGDIFVYIFAYISNMFQILLEYFYLYLNPFKLYNLIFRRGIYDINYEFAKFDEKNAEIKLEKVNNIITNKKKL